MREEETLRDQDQSELLIQKKISTRRQRRPILFFAVLAMILLAAILVMTLPSFRIKQIEVDGCSVLSKESILTGSGLSIGDHLLSNIGGGIVPLFTLQYGNIEKKLIHDYPYIGDIVIRISFPSKVVITVTERRKIGYIELPDGYAVIDTDGYVVELIDGKSPVGIPLMEGIPVRSAALGEKIDMSEAKGLNACITVLHAVVAADENKNEKSDFSLMKCVRSVRSVQSGTTFLTIVLPTNQKVLLVRIGSLKNITEDISWLCYAAEQNKFDSVGDGVLDMSGEQFTFRPAS